MDEYRKYRGKRFYDWLMGIPFVSGVVQMCLPDDPDIPSIDECQEALEDCMRDIYNNRDPHAEPFGVNPDDEEGLQSCIERKKKGCVDVLKTS